MNPIRDLLEDVMFLNQRNEIDHKYIGLIGHSEGGIIAPMDPITALRRHS